VHLRHFLSKKYCAVFLLCVAIPSRAQVLTTLVNFDDSTGFANGSFTGVQGTNGNFYGTTPGNASLNGTVFRVTPSGELATLYSFCLQAGCPDGRGPSFLTLGTNGNFYGTTSLGGAGVNGPGTVFEITPDGVLTTLYNFCLHPGCADGSHPSQGLIQAGGGTFYGATYDGGAYGHGTIYSITAAGMFKTLYSFCAQSGCPDGSNPYLPPIQANNGNFYGATSQGGIANNGTIFAMTANGKLTTIHAFTGYPTDGSIPGDWLVQGPDGNFYGTTQQGGADNAGTVFEITSGGSLILYSFCTRSKCKDGRYPYASLILGPDGHFYGTASAGGANGFGTIFRIAHSGKMTTMHSFDSSDGAYPYAALLQGTDGMLYGMTTRGGVFDLGTMFSLTTGLSPFIKLVQPRGSVGQTAQILGQAFTGTTGVTFNGIAASFTVVSDTYMTAVVPPGATTGPVVVTTPSGPLSSNKNFVVR
jgi:uncharacterized repeat protein (TIGR03803 family)